MSGSHERITLSDGTRVPVREVRPGDAPHCGAWWAG
jgi:hypothetical protein